MLRSPSSPPLAPLLTEIPDEADALRPWLESHLMGCQLGQLVAELEGVRQGLAVGGSTSDAGQSSGPTSEGNTSDIEAVTREEFEATFRETLPRVLQSGLAEFSDQQLSHLLRRPRWLPLLQERILLDGNASYWRLRPPPQELQALESDWQHLITTLRPGTVPPPLRFGSDAFSGEDRAILAVSSTTARSELGSEVGRQTARPASIPRTHSLPPSSRDAAQPVGPPGWYSRPWLVSLVTAAAVLVAVQLGLVPGVRTESRIEPAPASSATSVADTPTSAWGWTKESALDGSLSRKEYLYRLADGASEWFDRQPDDATSLALRIGQLRQGCSRIILSYHEPLSVADHVWLKERCQLWAKKLDQHVSDLEAGRDFATVQKEADETVRLLVSALKKRGEQSA